MSRLQILIPQYSESESVIKPLLDSIELQQNVDIKNDIEVFIGNDGSDEKLTKEFLEKYSFPIQYHFFEHSRLAGCRKKLFNLSTSEYVMFCDADDMFLTNIALHMIFCAMKDDTDCIVCDFYTEKYNNEGNMDYFNKTKDNVFVHGKVYRRQFLIDNKIEWHEELYEHQDSPYNTLALTLSKSTKYITIPLYLWKNNPDSISRRNGKDHIPNTWHRLIDSYDALISDLQARGFGVEARYYAMSCMYATYYEMSRDIWNEEKHKENRETTYKRLLEFFYKYMQLMSYLTDEKIIEKIKEITKKQAENRGGKMQEMPTIEEWMQSIINTH